MVKAFQKKQFTSFEACGDFRRLCSGLGLHRRRWRAWHTGQAVLSRHPSSRAFVKGAGAALNLELLTRFPRRKSHALFQLEIYKKYRSCLDNAG